MLENWDLFRRCDYLNGDCLEEFMSDGIVESVNYVTDFVDDIIKNSSFTEKMEDSEYFDDLYEKFLKETKSKIDKDQFVDTIFGFNQSVEAEDWLESKCEDYLDEVKDCISGAIIVNECASHLLYEQIRDKFNIIPFRADNWDQFKAMYDQTSRLAYDTSAYDIRDFYETNQANGIESKEDFIYEYNLYFEDSDLHERVEYDEEAIDWYADSYLDDDAEKICKLFKTNDDSEDEDENNESDESIENDEVSESINVMLKNAGIL